MNRIALAGVSALTLAIACSPIVAQPLSEAPLNAGCPSENACDQYVVDGATLTSQKPQCNDGRCEYGRPD